MGTVSRRDLCQSLPLLALLPALAQTTLAAQTQTAAPAAPQSAGAKPEPPPNPKLCQPLSVCQVFPSVPGREMKNGTGGHEILVGYMPGISNIEVHETKLDPGKAPHPPHRHSHAEVILVREGTIEFLNEDAPVTIGPGGMIYNAPNKLHGLHNVGETLAVYFVVELGREITCPA